MIRRADIEGSKSAVALCARVATSQFLGTALDRAFPRGLGALGSESRKAPEPGGISAGNRLYLRPRRVHTFPVVEARGRGLVAC
jgi:hypothetical protein